MCEETKNEEKPKTGIIAGVWDLLHPGHLAALKYCAENCDELYVALQTDPTVERKNKNKPIQTMYERYVQLLATPYVYNVIPYDTEQDLENILAMYHYDFLFVGEDHRNDVITGLENNKIALASDCEGFELKFVPRFHSYSSSELVERIINFYLDDLENIKNGK